MLSYWLAEAVDPTGTAPEYLTQILQWGPPGVVIVLIVLGVLVPKGAHAQMKQDRDDWKAAYDKEVTAHEQTRAAMADLTKVGEANLRASETALALLQNLGHIARGAS